MRGLWDSYLGKDAISGVNPTFPGAALPEIHTVLTRPLGNSTIVWEFMLVRLDGFIRARSPSRKDGVSVHVGVFHYEVVAGSE